MNEVLENLNQMSLEEQAVLGMLFLVLFFFLYRYVVRRDKKRLEGMLEHNLHVFQKTFDFSEDAIF